MTSIPNSKNDDKRTIGPVIQRYLDKVNKWIAPPGNMGNENEYGIIIQGYKCGFHPRKTASAINDIRSGKVTKGE